ncbi:Uncharacterized ABC transporter ATP-binding protein YbhF [Dermatophilus congolensis]|uniref:Uncharacterized ABC transporter ATP-binding protein YbhF n=1 Tax=Dermatophilus congolensis TaxID=1863 RepID=A0AA46H1J5_9MICO|nr:ABC transporter ATP-binding protein [Dermatophilus congolensis]STD15648.1 Uncharacterized ABC transporter ATP-binding protein YbhF [Dermatophilus congolensis]
MNNVAEKEPSTHTSGNTDEPGLQLTNIVLTHRKRTILDHTRLGVLPGTITALTGPAGSGKTTLMRVAAGILRPTSGTIRIAGIDPTTHPQQARAHTGWLPATRTNLGPVTPRELLRTFTIGHRLPERTGRLRTNELIERMNLTHVADTHASTLPLATQTLLMLACATIHNPAVLLLDEPLTGLDSDDRAHIADHLRAEAHRGTAILATAPDPWLLDEVAHRCVTIDHGRITGSHELHTTNGHRWRIVSLDGDILRTTLNANGVDYEDVPTPDGRLTHRAAVDVAMTHEREATALLNALTRSGVPVYGFGPSNTTHTPLNETPTIHGHEATP